MNRALLALEIKAIDADGDERRIEGWASLPAVDRVGDIVVPRGAIYTLPLPFLLDHDHRQAVGEVDRVEVTDKGIKFWAHIKKIAEPGEVKDLCDKAWTLVKHGLRKVVSIGFSPLEYDLLPSGGLKFTSWEWLELSACTVAAAPGAQITSIKNFAPGDKFATVCPELPNPIDATLLAASGHKQFAVVRLTPPGVSGTKQHPMTPKEGSNVKISEKIARFEQKRAANVARIAEVHESTDESLNEQQLEEVKNLEAEVATIDRDLPSLKSAEATLARTATPVVVNNDGSRVAATPGVSVKQQPKLEPGIGYARLVKVKMAARLDGESPLVMARKMYGPDSEVVGMIQKANEVVAGTTIAGNWAADLVGTESGAVAAFLEYLRPATILGKFGTDGVPSLTSLDFFQAYITETGAGDAYWVGEGKPKPLTSFNYDRGTMTPLKIANIAVLTEENIRYSSPNSDMLVRNSLVKAIAAGLDVAFIDPANAGSANVKPASVTNGAETVVSTGDTADAIRVDVRALFQKFIDANNAPESGVWIMSATNALALSLMVNALDQASFPGITMKGGRFQGLPVIASQHIGDVVALVNATDIFLGDEGGVAVDMSREASIEMRSTGLGMDATAGTATTGSVSMFQTNSVALRAERTINWKRARASAVAYLTSAGWGGAVPAS